MNPSRGAVASEPFELRVDRNSSLPGRAWRAPNPRALIAIAHGIGEYCARYSALASDLARAGYTVVSVDFPGHGDARGPRGDIPSWLRLRDQVLPGLLTAGQSLDGIPERLPRVVFGHSMGGVLALDFALHQPRAISAVAVSAVGLKSAPPPWWKLMMGRIAKVVAPSAGFPTGLNEGGMSRDPEVEKLRAEDAMIHRQISPRLYFAFLDARARVLNDAKRLAIPALLMHGEADSVVDIEGSREVFAAAPKGLATLITYPDAYHEIFNDPARDQAVSDLVKWLGQVLPR